MPSRDRYQVSVRGSTYDRIANYADAHDVSLTSVVERACEDVTPAQPVIGVSLPLYERICAYAKKQGLTPELVVKLALAKLTRREP